MSGGVDSSTGSFPDKVKSELSMRIWASTLGYAVLFTTCMACSSTAFGLSCFSISIEEEFKVASAVFTGKVVDKLEVERTSNDGSLGPVKVEMSKFRVYSSWKGIDVDTVLVLDGLRKTMTFRVGAEYLVFAGRDKKDYGLRPMTLCGGSTTSLTNDSVKRMEIFGPPTLTFDVSETAALSSTTPPPNKSLESDP